MINPGRSASRIVKTVFDLEERYRLENEILRILLLERGLTRRQIQKEVLAYLAKRKSHQVFEQTLARANREILAALDDLDLEKQLAKIPLPAKSRMN